MLEKINKQEMNKIKGGISQKQYCAQLVEIVMNNDLDAGAMEGARHAWGKHCS